MISRKVINTQFNLNVPIFGIEIKQIYWFSFKFTFYYSENYDLEEDDDDESEMDLEIRMAFDEFSKNQK